MEASFVVIAFECKFRLPVLVEITEPFTVFRIAEMFPGPVVNLIEPGKPLRVAGAVVSVGQSEQGLRVYPPEPL